MIDRLVSKEMAAKYLSSDIKVSWGGGGSIRGVSIRGGVSLGVCVP